MARRPSNLPTDAAGTVDKFINTAYDNVKLVADHLDVIIELSEAPYVDHYLGALPGQPTVRPDGDPLRDGDFYVDTTDDLLYYYNGVEDDWIQIDTVQATQSAQDAEASAAAALASEQAAAISEANAAASAAQAAADAIATGDDRAQTGLDAAATAADVSTTNADAAQTAQDVLSTGNDASNSTLSANAASASASAAADSATAAATSQSSAAVSATNALASQAAASTSETNAAASEASVAADAQAASDSATSASTDAAQVAASVITIGDSVTTAANSAASAANSAANASTSQIAAASSAASANTSAGDAASSATTAATSESNASASETAAAQSASDAATSAIILSTGVVPSGPWDASNGQFPPQPADLAYVHSYRVTDAGTMTIGGVAGQTPLTVARNDVIYTEVYTGIWYKVIGVAVDMFDPSEDQTITGHWSFLQDLQVTATLTADDFSGDGSAITNVDAVTVDGHTVDTDVPSGALFTDTVYDDTALAASIPTDNNQLTNGAGYITSAGDAATVNGHTVETDVPTGAVFTDTVYDDTAVYAAIPTDNAQLTNGADYLTTTGDGSQLTGIFGGGPSEGTNSVIRTNAITIDENITIPVNTNGTTAGPISISDGYSVTIEDGSTWTIL